MTGAPKDGRRASLERSGFEALCVALLAPVIAQGLFRPVAHVAGTAGGAAGVTVASLAIGVVIVLIRQLRPGRQPWLPWIAGGLSAAIASLALSVGLAGLVTLLGVAAAIAGFAPRLSSRLPSTFDGLAGRHKVLTMLYLVGSLVAVLSTARVSAFIGDPSRVDLQALPGNDFVETHSCLTAYVRASALVHQGVDNVYEDHWWYGSNGLPPLPAGVENPYRPFLLDNFSYPPPFLLVMAPLAPLTGDFLAQRALWFGLSGLLLALGLWIVALWIDGPGAHRTLLLAPLLFGTMPLLVALQIGNFHVAAVVLSVIAMVALDRGRAATGGALLALTILSKVSPGILGLVLLVERRIRHAAITAGFGVALVTLSVVRFGTAPIKSFLSYALPRLSSGRAFPFMDIDAGLLTNMSLFGFPFKLRHLGLDVGDPWLLAPRIAHGYTLALVVLGVVAARRRGDRRDRAVTWMALLVLAALQSPFAPGYVTIALLWATTLLAAEVRGPRGAVSLVLFWLLALMPPGPSAAIQMVQSMVQTAVVLGVSVWLIVRAPRGLDPLGPARSP